MGKILTTYKFETLDVFTDRRFGGNPLAVFTDARGMTTSDMQALAAEMNLSETTFVLPPAHPENTAQVRIFNRTAEMDFAGHPTLGTGCVIARLKPEVGNTLRLEVPAGVVQVSVHRDLSGIPSGGIITAPQPLNILGHVEAEIVASCLSIGAGDVVTAAHVPTVASMGNPYVIAEVTPAALSRCDPQLGSFRDALLSRPDLGDRFSIHVYTTVGDGIRARMFAPLAGTWEDPATGSANAPLGGLLLSLTSEQSAEFLIHQGLEIGRPSELRVVAERGPSGIIAHIEGKIVPVFQGQIAL